MDPLSDVLRSVRLKGAVYIDARFTAPWCIYSQLATEHCRMVMRNASQMISYHYITVGRMYVWVDGHEPVQVEAGDLVVLPRNDRHYLASELGLPAFEGRKLVVPSEDGGFGRINYGGGGDAAELVCGFLGSEDQYSPLISALPPIIKINVEKAASRALIEASLLFAIRELTQNRAAGVEVLSRISELLFVEAVRSYAESADECEAAWLKGFSDPQIGPVLAAMHGDLNRDWTADELAGLAAMSRSAFMERFSGVAGVPPIKYLTRWRLDAAKRKLSDRAKSIAQVAYDSGYESEDTFGRAFKREFGLAPGRWREAHA